MIIEIANIAHIDGLWPIVGPKFHAASQRCGDDLTAGQLWQMCRSGNAFLVIGHIEGSIKVAAAVRFDAWGNGCVLRVLSLVGDGIKEWAVPLRDYLADMAKENGASRLVAEGREGWERVFDNARRLRSTFVMEIA